MATASKRSQDEEETTDTSGRKHDGRGRFASDTESESGRGNQGRSQGNGQGAKGGQGGQGGSAGAAQKRVISRAVRVLNEIEARIHELREELEEQGGGSGGEGNGNGFGRGQVKNPETDGRLKQNRDGGADDEEDEDETGEESANRGRAGSRR